MNIFGGNTGMSYDDIQRKRKIAERLMAQNASAPRNVGEGLHAIGRALAARAIEKRTGRAEKDLRDQFSQQFDQVAPQSQAMIDLYNNPMASEGHKKILGALMKGGVPGYSRGGKSKGGLAIVGEAGPELVELPKGAKVKPVYGFGMDQSAPPDPADQYFRDEMGDDINIYEGMSPEQRIEWLNNPENGFVPPAPIPAQDVPMSSFDDAASFQVAQAGPLEGMAEPPAVGVDPVGARRLVDDEVVYRDALNGLSGIMERLQNNPDLLEDAHTWAGRASTNILRLRDRSGIEAFDIGPEEEERLANSTAYKQELLTRVNQYIKDITGAQVGQGDETKRLMAVQANESDSPTQIIAKISNALDLARLDIARRRYMQRTEGPAPSDKELREFLRSRGRELYDLARSEGLSPTEARMRAAEMLSEEYGF